MKKILIVILLLFFLICLGFFLKNEKFKIVSVEYKDNVFVQEEQLEDFFRVLKEQNIIYAGLYFQFLEKSFLRKIPKVKSLRLRLKFPDKLVLEITEKQPWVLFLTEDDNYFLAKDGTILGRSGNPTGLNNLDKLIIIRGVGSEYLQDIFVSQEWLTKITRIIENIRFYFSTINIQIEFREEDNIVLLKDDTLPIKLGNMEKIEEKFRNLKWFFKYSKDWQENKIEYIDLRVVNKVVVKKI
jgi:cell division septal protein FtsQ